jgi:hypothetical protein
VLPVSRRANQSLAPTFVCYLKTSFESARTRVDNVVRTSGKYRGNGRRILGYDQDGRMRAALCGSQFSTEFHHVGAFAHHNNIKSVLLDTLGKSAPPYYCLNVGTKFSAPTLERLQHYGVQFNR